MVEVSAVPTRGVVVLDLREPEEGDCDVVSLSLPESVLEFNKAFDWVVGLSFGVVCRLLAFPGFFMGTLWSGGCEARFLWRALCKTIFFRMLAPGSEVLSDFPPVKEVVIAVSSDSLVVFVA